MAAFSRLYLSFLVFLSFKAFQWLFSLFQCNKAKVEFLLCHHEALNIERHNNDIVIASFKHVLFSPHSMQPYKILSFLMQYHDILTSNVSHQQRISF